MITIQTGEIQTVVSESTVRATITIERRQRGRDNQYHSEQFVTLPKDVLPELIEALQNLA